MKIADFGLKNLNRYVFEKNIVVEDVDMLDRVWTNLRFLRTWSVFYFMSYTSVPITGSNFGNFFNGALKDFEAKQASRIRVRVWEFLWVIFLRNV